MADRYLTSAQNIAQQLAATGGATTLAIEVDVTQADQVQRMVDQVLAAWGQLDVAVNSAGIARRSRAEELEEDDWDAVVGVDLKGIYLSTRAEGRAMLARGSGSIINIASMSGRIVNRPQLHSHYNAAKAGVIQYSRSCAAEWAARGVRVNCISPGHTVTPMTANLPYRIMGDEWLSRTRPWDAMVPAGRPAGRNALFLASAASAYVTGHDLVVDGGYTLW